MFRETLLHREGLVSFEPQGVACTFNVRKMQREIMASETLEDLLARKIQRLSGDIRDSKCCCSIDGVRFQRFDFFAGGVGRFRGEGNSEIGLLDVRHVG